MRAIVMGLLLGMCSGCDWVTGTPVPDSANQVDQQLPELEKWVPATPEQNSTGKFLDQTRILEAEQSELKRLNKEKLDRLTTQAAEQRKLGEEQTAFEQQWDRLKKLPGFSEKDQKYYESIQAKRAERSKKFAEAEAAYKKEIEGKILAQEIRVEAARAALKSAEKVSQEESR